LRLFPRWRLECRNALDGDWGPLGEGLLQFVKQAIGIKRGTGDSILRLEMPQ
jgi:hypothetical protein